MEIKKSAKKLKVILVIMTIILFVACLIVAPAIGKSILFYEPSFSYGYWPWLIFIWATFIPVFISTKFFYNLVDNIEKNHIFTMENAKILLSINTLIKIDLGICIIGSIIMIIILSHIGMLLLYLMYMLILVTAHVLFSTLAMVIEESAKLKEDSDLTI